MTQIPFTSASVVAMAKSQRGYTEKPVNRTKYGVAYGWDGVAWCGIFVWWVFSACGLNLRALGISQAAGTNEFDAEAHAAGWRLIPARDVIPGDVVFYNFGVVGPGDSAHDDDHVGIAVSKPYFGFVTAVEGNTEPGGGGSQSNGGGVYQRTRNVSLIRHAYRPPYSTAAQVSAVKRAVVAATRARLAARAAAARAKAAVIARKKAAAAAAIAAAIAAAATANHGGGSATSTQVAPTPSISSTATPGPAATLKPTPQPVVIPKPVVKPKPKPFTLTRILKYRPGHPLQHGADVRRVQVLVGLKGKAVDGEYGKATAAKVAGWQRAHGLKHDGDFGASSARRAGWRWSG